MGGWWRNGRKSDDGSVGDELHKSITSPWRKERMGVYYGVHDYKVWTTAVASEMQLTFLQETYGRKTSAQETGADHAGLQG